MPNWAQHHLILLGCRTLRPIISKRISGSSSINLHTQLQYPESSIKPHKVLKDRPCQHWPGRKI